MVTGLGVKYGVLGPVVFLFVVNSALATSACLQNWVRFADSCYLYVSETHSFFNIQKICKREKGHTVDITSERENVFVTGFIQPHERYVWLAVKANDRLKSGGWSSTVTRQGLNYANWGPGKPAGGITRNRGFHDCVILRLDGTWSDVGCWSRYAGVCEKRV